MISKVNELFVPGSRQWDEELVRNSFYECGVQDILQTHVIQCDGEDFSAWHFTKNGLFSIKSAYHLQCSTKFCGNRKASTSSGHSHRGWLNSWSAD